MDANKKIDLEHVQCPSKSKILTNTIKNHPLRFSIAASSSVPWNYMAQFWHTLKEDGSKYRLKFMLDRKELSLTLDDFRTILHLPQATNNNHDRFVPPLSFYDMILFYKNHFGFTMELKTPSSFKTTGLLQLWQTDAIGRNSLFSSSFHIFDSLSKIHEDYHWTLSAPRSPTPKVDATESSVPTLLTVVRLSLPQQKSTRLTPPAPALTVDKADELNKIHYKLKRWWKDKSMLLMIVQSLGMMNIIILVARLEPRSDKESLEVEFTDVVIPVNVYDEEEEKDKITNEVYELKQNEKGKNVEESRIIPSPTPIRYPRIHTDLVSLNNKKLQELTARFMPQKSFGTFANHLHNAMTESLPVMVDKHVKEQVEQQVPEQVHNQVPVYVAKGLILERQKTKEEMEKMIAKAILQEPQTTSVREQQYQLYLLMKEDPQWQQQDIAIWLALQMKFERLQVPQTTCRTPIVRLRNQDDPHDDAHPEGEKSAKRQKTLDHKEILVSPHLRKTTPLVLSCQRDPEAPAPSLINQDLLYLKKENSGPEKIVLSLYKFPEVVFNDDDIEEQTSRWVNKCVKKFNPYAQYGVEH
nr:hypothetical protein [Tanacetum cinerariifolium]